ncbi:hypothetical protein ACE193_04030 [Bernardetia sp. OM2101]|uniref:hypothetical protein n=1 Tax=Bernardetia sp. OM2101 TaxID=3344876 RepID=UPI0035CFA63F
MKKIILVIVLSFFCSISFAQVEGVEVEKPQEDEKEEKKEEKESEDDDDEKIPLIDRFYFGGNLGGTFGRFTYIDISPIIGYRLTPKFSVGVGGTYQYQRQNDNGGNLLWKQNIYGGRLFSRYIIAEDFLNVGNLFAHAEYESLFAKFSYTNISGVAENTQAFPAFFVGGGLVFPIGNRAGFTISALYNPFYDQYNSIYGSPLQVRVGGFF